MHKLLGLNSLNLQVLEVSTSVATAFVVASLSFSSSLSSLSFFFSLETSTPSVFSLDLDLKGKIKGFLEHYSFSQGKDTYCWTDTKL